MNTKKKITVDIKTLEDFFKQVERCTPVKEVKKNVGRPISVKKVECKIPKDPMITFMKKYVDNGKRSKLPSTHVMKDSSGQSQTDMNETIRKALQTLEEQKNAECEEKRKELELKYEETRNLLAEHIAARKELEKREKEHMQEDTETEEKVPDPPEERQSDMNNLFVECNKLKIMDKAIMDMRNLEKNIRMRMYTDQREKAAVLKGVAAEYVEHDDLRKNFRRLYNDLRSDSLVKEFMGPQPSLEGSEDEFCEMMEFFMKFHEEVVSIAEEPLDSD